MARHLGYLSSRCRLLSERAWHGVLTPTRGGFPYGLRAPDHITVDTYGKKFFPTPSRSPYSTKSPALSTGNKGSCSTSRRTRRLRCDAARCWTLIHCVSSSSNNSSCGDAKAVGYSMG